MADISMGKYRQMTTYGGSEGISPHIPNLETKRRYEISLTPLPLYDRAMRSGSCGERITLLVWPKIKPPIHLTNTGPKKGRIFQKAYI
jgi:hypothetical protein